MPHSQVLPPHVSERIKLLQARSRYLPRSRSTVKPGSQRDDCWRRTWSFPTREAAERWNAEWEEALERPGCCHPALLRIDGIPIRDHRLDALARVAGTILSEEVYAGAPYPLMRACWSYRLDVRHTLYRARREHAVPSIIVSAHGEVHNADGELHWSSDATRQYPTSVIPTSVAECWSGGRWHPTSETYA